MSLYEKLFPYQRKIVDEIKDRNRYGLFLDMGLGKTVLALALAEVNLCTKVIVISINSKAEESENLKGSWLWWSKQSSIEYNRWNKKIFKPTKKNPNTFSTDTNDILLLNFEGLYSRNKDIRGIALKKELKDFILASKGHNIAVIIDHSVLQEAINRDYVECLPDLTGLVGTSEYRLTAYGEKVLLDD